MSRGRVVALVVVAVAAVVLAVAVVNASTRTAPDPSAGERSSGLSVNTDPGPAFVGFVGDSYTAGAGASVPANRWTTLVRTEEVWSEFNVAASGAGYGSGSTPFYDQIANLPAREYRVIMVSGGRIDMSSPRTYPAGITRTFETIKSRYPNAQVLAVSPIWDYRAPAPEFAQLQQAVRAGAEAVGGTYLDIGEPLAGHRDWVTSSNAPNDLGHAAIAAAVARSLPR